MTDAISRSIAAENEPSIYLDADACPVKDTVYKVAERYNVRLFVVANAPMRMPPSSGLRAKLVVVPGAMDAADDWIAERAIPGDLVLTADIPLASRTVTKGVKTLDFRGREFTDASIGNALASREINAYLRALGEGGGGPPAFSTKDRGKFASLLDNVVSNLARRRDGGR
jgi:uncharacterized protein YaiI (UPF0178 family)